MVLRDMDLKNPVWVRMLGVKGRGLGNRVSGIRVRELGSWCCLIMSWFCHSCLDLALSCLGLGLVLS
jgi:hypothetical protein